MDVMGGGWTWVHKLTSKRPFPSAISDFESPISVFKAHNENSGLWEQLIIIIWFHQWWSKTTFEKEEPKVLIYRDCKKFSFTSFKSELLSKFHHNNVIFTSFENNFVNVLNQQDLKKINSFLWLSKAPFK